MLVLGGFLFIPFHWIHWQGHSLEVDGNWDLPPPLPQSVRSSMTSWALHKITLCTTILSRGGSEVQGNRSVPMPLPKFENWINYLYNMPLSNESTITTHHWYDCLVFNLFYFWFLYDSYGRSWSQAPCNKTIIEASIKADHVCYLKRVDGSRYHYQVVSNNSLGQDVTEMTDPKLFSIFRDGKLSN